MEIIDKTTPPIERKLWSVPIVKVFSASRFNGNMKEASLELLVRDSVGQVMSNYFPYLLVLLYLF